MNRSAARLLQAATVLLGIAVFGFLLWEPNVEGRNAHATLFEVYFNDPFLACAYTASVPFFVALYQAFRLFGDAGRNDLVSPRSLSALRTIRHCALLIIGCVLVAEAYLFIVVRGQDDIAGGVAMGIVVAMFSAIAATMTALFERNLQTHILT
jgi:hypothetical protein